MRREFLALMVVSVMFAIVLAQSKTSLSISANGLSLVVPTYQGNPLDRPPRETADSAELSSGEE